MKASEVRKGHVLMVDGQPCRVMDFQHRTPGNLRAFVQVRMRNLVTGNTFDSRFIATEYVDEARLDTKEFQVLYRDDQGVHVMDSSTYDQYTLPNDVAGDAAPWLEPEIHIQAELLDGQVVGLQLPAAMEYTIADTSPVMKTATKTASTKPAKLSNGITIQVPEFLDTGTRIRVDPRTWTYLERAK
jgi:elongation factor P